MWQSILCAAVPLEVGVCVCGTVGFFWAMLCFSADVSACCSCIMPHQERVGWVCIVASPYVLLLHGCCCAAVCFCRLASRGVVGFTLACCALWCLLV